MVTQVRDYFVIWILLDLWVDDPNFEVSSNDNIQQIDIPVEEGSYKAG
jgi:hypothetical protein